jgi:RNA polymerase sigma factor (sigma-70 family)
MSRLSARYAHLIEICRRRGCSGEDAKELVQEAHLRLFEYQRSAKVKDVDSLLRRIVINLSISRFHRELSTRFVFERVDELDRQGVLIDPTAGPERTLAAEQQLDRVVGLLSAVSRRSCQIFIAQRGGYSYEEIAAAFGVMPRTVEKHVTSAIAALREMMPAAFAPGARTR